MITIDEYPMPLTPEQYAELAKTVGMRVEKYKADQQYRDMAARVAENFNRLQEIKRRPSEG